MAKLHDFCQRKQHLNAAEQIAEYHRMVLNDPSIFLCVCGSKLFYILKHRTRCANCGLEEEYPEPEKPLLTI